MAAIVDITLVAQEENSRYLKSAGGKLIYMPLGCNEPDTKCLREDVATDYGRILFFGSAHSRIRYHLLNSLARQNISIACMGAGWHEPNEQTKVHPRRGYEYTGWLLNQQLPSLHYRILTSGMAPVLGGILNRVLPWPKLSTRVELLGEVRREEVNAYLSRSFANVSTAIHGSGWMLRRPMFQVKLRDFEIPTFPRPYVTSSFPEIAKFFVPDDEIVVYSSNAELADKIRQLQSNPALAARIGAQGSDRVRRDHTWDRRLADLSRQAAIPEMRPV
ncbi:MAG: glycosyltransferase [Geminicoccaceae bacterium]